MGEIKFMWNLKVCKNSVAHSISRKIYILDCDISNIIKPMFQRLNMSVNGLDLCADKFQRFEAYIPGHCLYSGKRDPRITWILANFLRSIDISRSNYLDVRAIVNVICFNKIISIVKVPMRLRSSTFELTGVYFRGELYHFDHMDWQKIRLGLIRAQIVCYNVLSYLNKFCTKLVGEMRHLM